MARYKQLPANLAAHRVSQGLSQNAYWSRFGIGQSGGSRYESEHNKMPSPLKILFWLHINGRITDLDLANAKVEVGLK